MKILKSLVVAVAFACGAATAGEPETAWQKVQAAFTTAIEKGHKSSVAIHVKGKFPKPKDPHGLDARPLSDNQNPAYYQRPSGPSSGVVIDAEGHVLTSWFNVNATKIERIDVTLPDGTKVQATLLGHDESKDIALLKFDPAGATFTPIEWSEDQLQVGSFVMALGRAPEPARGTATRGIVSAVDRLDHATNGIFEHSIQFDAKTNYGNSGGPVVDLRGRLVGVVTHVRERTPWGQNSGISFATPNYKIREVLDRLKKGEAIKRPKLPFLGVAAAEGNTEGVVLGQVVPDTAAAEAGLKAGDTILEINKQKVASWEEFTGHIKKCKVGDAVTLTVKRGDETLTVTATLRERPRQ